MLTLYLPVPPLAEGHLRAGVIGVEAMDSVAGSFGVGIASGGPLASYLSTNSTTGLFGALNAGAGNPTNAALTTGALTNKQHTIITTVGAAGTAGYAIGWNSTGTEPSALSTLRGYGWLKLAGKSYDSSTKAFKGTYTLTQIGKAILARTGGGKIGATDTSATDLTASLQDTLTSQVGAISSTLAAVGITV